MKPTKPKKPPGETRGGKQRNSGRKKKSAAEQKLEGNVGHRPDHGTIPFPVIKAPPDPPEWLGEYAQEYWRDHAPQLVLMKILTTVSLPSYTQLAVAWDTFRRACDELDMLPSWVGADGKMSPWLKARNDAGKIFHQLAAAFQVLPCEAVIPSEGKGERAADFSRAK